MDASLGGYALTLPVVDKISLEFVRRGLQLGVLSRYGGKAKHAHSTESKAYGSAISRSGCGRGMCHTCLSALEFDKAMLLIVCKVGITLSLIHI